MTSFRKLKSSLTLETTFAWFFMNDLRMAKSGSHLNLGQTSFTTVSIAFKMVLRQFWWKVFGKAILKNKLLSKTCQFRNKKETREFKHLRFYRINNLSPKLTKNHFKCNTHNSANRQKVLENIGKMGIKEMLSNQLFANAEKVIEYAVNNSGMMSRQLDQQLLYQILFEHFSEDQL